MKDFKCARKLGLRCLVHLHDAKGLVAFQKLHAPFLQCCGFLGRARQECYDLLDEENERSVNHFEIVDFLSLGVEALEKLCFSER